MNGMRGRTPGESDATERVLSAMLMETLDLMSEISGVGDHRAASGESSPHETAVYLRLSARLARIGGWIMAQEVGDAKDKSVARVALRQARRSDLDNAADVGPLAQTAARVDRLAERAARLEELLHESPAPIPTRPSQFGEITAGEAQVLVFPSQSGAPS